MAATKVWAQNNIKVEKSTTLKDKQNVIYYYSFMRDLSSIWTASGITGLILGHAEISP
jgi:hypothetical protein